MQRYNINNNVQTSYNGRQFFGTRTYPVIYPQSTDILYISNDADYLDSLAYKFYQDKTLWWIIALANNLGTGKLSIPEGTQLHIPTQINSILTQYNSLNQ